MTTDLFTYVQFARGAAVAAQEVESERPAIEVRILWGSTVLQVAHLSAPRAFFVGESSGKEGECDYSVSARVLGARRLPIVIVDRAGGSRLVFPATAVGHTETRGGDRESLDDLRASGVARPSRDWPGACELEMTAGATARIELGCSALAFQVSMVNAGRRVPGGAFATLEPGDFVYAATSFLLHVGVIALLAFFMPKMAKGDGLDADRDDIVAIQKLLDASATRELSVPEGIRSVSSLVAEVGRSAASAHGDAGMMGSPHTLSIGRYGIEGARDAADPHVARDAALREAARFGPIELLLGTMPALDPRGSAAEWGRPVAHGADDRSALGRMFEKDIGDAVGTGGLDLAGANLGGGGPADTIGLGEMNGLSLGPGGPDDGVGGSRAPRPRTHTAAAPRVRDSVATINGRLRPEIIQRVVRQNFGRFRFCYEAGLRTNPSLEGRVVVRFLIDRTGAVGLAGEAGGDLADTNVVRCVVRAFGDLSFPSPEGGMVTVVYPILFNAAESRPE
jgi:hypothetical protein